MSASSKRFRVAFSFAGEKRDFVSKVAAILAQRFNEAAILYDKYHEAEFARRNLGIYLPELYHEQSDLVVVVICGDYEKKEWCGLEWAAIHALLKNRRDGEVMLANFDHATVKGIYDTAGFVDLDKKTSEQAAILILERLAINESKPKNYYTAPSSPSPSFVGRENVKYGSTIRLTHKSTGVFLKSVPKHYSHAGTSGQQMVNGSLGRTGETVWKVKGEDKLGEAYPVDKEVCSGDLIRLEHESTGRNLHSHGDCPSPVTGQQEVTCLGTNGRGDANDNWLVETEGGGAWEFDKEVRLIHANTSKALHSHGRQSHPLFTDGEQEVTAHDSRDGNDLWLATVSHQPRQKQPNRTAKQFPIEVSQETRNTSHDAWEVYDLRRTSRLNVKYYQCLAEKLSTLGFRIELILAITAPSSAVAGLVFWQTSAGKIAWAILGTAAAFFSVVKPLLHLTEKIQNATEIQAGYAALEHDLDKLSAQIRHRKAYHDDLKKEFLGLMDKKGKLVAVIDRNKLSTILKKRCEAEVQEELPAESFYIPPTLTR